MSNSTKSHWFPVTDVGWSGKGHVHSLEASISMDIIKHCALVTAKPKGEDSAGRAKLDVMLPEHVAERACDIAAGLVREWETRGWIKECTLNPVDDWTSAGRLEGHKRAAALAIELGPRR